MAFEATKLDTTLINKNEEYEIGDGLQPEAINNIVGGILYVQNNGGGGSNITVDSDFSMESENPIQNKVVTQRFFEVGDTANQAYNMADDALTRVGNLENQGGSIIVDSELNTDSENPVQNRPVAIAIDQHEQQLDNLANRVFDLEESGGSSNIIVDTELNTDSTNPVQNKVVAEALQGKLDKLVITPNQYAHGKEVILYGVSAKTGEQTSISAYHENLYSSFVIVQRTTNGHIYVPNIPSTGVFDESHRKILATNKNYVDTAVNSVKPYTHIINIVNEENNVNITLTVLSVSASIFDNFINTAYLGTLLFDCTPEIFKSIIQIYAEGTHYNGIDGGEDIVVPKYRLLNKTSVPVISIETEKTLPEISDGDTTITITTI